MTSPSRQLEVFELIQDSLVKKKQPHSYNSHKDMEHKKGSRSTSSSEVHKFNNLTFLACGKHEMSRFGKTEMILQITQIVHNDILVKSAHDHLRCKCDTPSMKTRK